MKNLPAWSVYLISGLGAVVMLLIGVSGSMVLKDRDSIEKTMCQIKNSIKEHHMDIQKVIDRQDRQIQLLSTHNDRQNHVMDKVCLFLSVPYEKRKEMMRDYPLVVKPQPVQ